MMRTTHTSTVTEDQIDHLGHMNVMFYAQNARAASRRLLTGLPGWGDLSYEVHDVYTRHHREQLLGSSLVVRSAVLAAGPSMVELHHELANAERDELAATFVHRVRPLDADGDATGLPEATLTAARAQTIEAPAYAAPRSISLEADLVAGAPSLGALLDRGLAMRRPRTISADECDAQGRFNPDTAPMLVWGGERLEGQAVDYLEELPDGRQVGWASMETRLQIGGRAEQGTRIQSFSAVVEVHDKVMHTTQWAFDLDSGQLLVAFEVVNLAFDIEARRPMSVPDQIRRRLLAALQPDLRPQPVG